MGETVITVSWSIFSSPSPKASFAFLICSESKRKDTRITENSWAYMFSHLGIPSLSLCFYLCLKFSGRNYDWVHFDQVLLLSPISSEKYMYKVLLFKKVGRTPTVSESRGYRTALLQMVFTTVLLC